MRPYDTVDFSPTDSCPLQCTFCYARSQKTSKWSEERADKALDLVLKTAGKCPDGQTQVNWFWLGGEPMMEKENIFAYVAKVKRDRPNVFFHTSATTNLVPITKDDVRRMKELGIFPHCSIDGCPESHDMDRKFINGDGSSTIVFEHARWMLDAFPTVAVRQTVTPSNAYLLAASASYLARFRFTDISQVPVNGAVWSEDNLSHYEEQAMKVADWWVQCIRVGVNPRVSWLQNALKKIWDPVRRFFACEAGVSRFAVSTDGTLWPCHYFVGMQDKQWSLGDLDNGFANSGIALRKEIMALRNRDILDGHDCDHCDVVNACDDICIHRSILAGNRLDAVPPDRCRITRANYRAALWAHAKLIREGGPAGDWYQKIFRPKMQESKLSQDLFSRIPIVKVV